MCESVCVRVRVYSYIYIYVMHIYQVILSEIIGEPDDVEEQVC